MSADDTISSELYSTLNSELIHIQLNDYDFYLTKPGRLDALHGNSLPMNEYVRVPIIRVYGHLPSGHQVLCHVHGVFPYIFIPYDGQDSDTPTTMNQKCAQLHNVLEIKSQLSMVKKKDIKQFKQKISGLKYIANVSVVKGVPFYGFNVGWSLFYKISVLDAGFTNKLSDLIRDGKMFEKPIETFESQLPFLLQFSADFNLFGCSWVDLEQCYFRTPVLNAALDLDKILHNEELEKFLEHFRDESSNTLSEKEFPRMGNGLLEIDVLPQFIRNVDDVHFRDLHHNFCEKLDDTSKLLSKPFVSSTKNIIREISAQRQALSLDAFMASASIPRLVDENVQWQSSNMFEGKFEKAVSQSGSLNTGTNFHNYVQSSAAIDTVKKIRDSISELWPRRPDLNLDLEKPKVIPDVVDTLDCGYNVAYVSDGENVEVPSSQDIEDRNNLFKDRDKDKSDNGSELRAEHLTGSTDLTMTQNMAKKYRKRSRFASTLSNSRGRKKNKIQRAGIKNPAGSFVYVRPPIDFSMILSDLELKGFPKIDYRDPYYGNPLDLRQKPYVYAGKRFEILSPHLSCRIPVPFSEEHTTEDRGVKENIFHSWKYLKRPPSFAEIKADLPRKTKNRFKSQLENPISKDEMLYKGNTDQQAKSKNIKVHSSLTHFTLEIHVQTEGAKLPDPQKDEVSIIFWHLERDSYPFDFHVSPMGIMVLKSPDVDDNFTDRIQRAAGKIPVAFYDDEFDLFDALVDIVLIFDPDLLSGFEVHSSSWGYIIERCRQAHRFEIADEISRVNSSVKTKLRDQWGYSHASSIVISGRHMINVWRAVKDDLALTKYTIENIAYVAFRQRLPHFSFQSLSEMWRNNHNLSSAKTVLSYWVDRVELNIRLLQKQEYIPRVTELSRLTGIDFYSVYYRGSQYKIESILGRLCKAESFIMVAPSKRRVKQQNALECVPLVMEPESAFYKSPLVVLDFQSLYPSIMMAYNYCYSTMLGRVPELKVGENIIGASQVILPEGLLTLLADNVTISPNGIAYVKSTIRKSTLAKMLEDILDTRFMVKKTMTDIGRNNAFSRRLLNSRQLALKLIANVTYGYTSASFSGRMPCSDLADSVVQTGRETLEKAIDFIESNPDWGAKVVYGDTDSLFVYLPGKSREEAFTIGKSMALEVTKRNPAPVELKFEKVYHPSLLVSKKRYVGYMYDKNAKQDPIFDAKGIETVRRDGHRAQQKIVEKSIRILFETQDLSKVKHFIQDEFTKIRLGTVSVQDFCFSKVVRLGAYKSEQTAPPGAVVAKRMMKEDHRAAPQYKERVPYVVVKGPAGQLLRERCLSPEEFMANDSLELDSEYYINKTLVPPLERLFNILGINVSEWAFQLTRHKNLVTSMDAKSIDSNLSSTQCIKCRGEIGKSDSLLCENCLSDRPLTASQLILRTTSNESRLRSISTVCRTCCYRYSNDASEVSDHIGDCCNSYDCPVYFGRMKARGSATSKRFVQSAAALKAIDYW